jgi:hypothetical protein
MYEKCLNFLLFQNNSLIHKGEAMRDCLGAGGGNRTRVFSLES